MQSQISVFIGFFFTFMPQFLLGNAGMPRRYYSYPEEYQWLNVLSTGGATVLAAGMVMTLVYLAIGLRKGDPVPHNPWNARSYEWLSPSPPPTHNFTEQPDMQRGPYDYFRSED